MTNKKPVKNPSVRVPACPLLSIRVASVFAEKMTLKKANVLKSLVMVPRAGLEPARPLFTKLRILSPARIFNNLFECLDLFEIFKTGTRQKPVNLSPTKATLVLCASLFIFDHNSNSQHRNHLSGGTHETHRFALL